MKEMTYSKDRKIEVLNVVVPFDGYYGIVINMGWYPCAYIHFPGIEKVHDYGDVYVDADVHGGFTFFDTLDLPEYKRITEDKWLGWDYAHACDYSGFLEIDGVHKWTTQEITDEIVAVLTAIHNGDWGIYREEPDEDDDEDEGLTLHTYFGTYKNCHISTSHYKADNSLYVELWNEEEGPIAVLTVCLSNKALKENQSYLDENNCPGAMEFIEKYNLGKDTGRIKPSGYCIYSLVEWNIDELKKYA